MKELIARFILPAAYDVLPMPMRSDRASAMLIAIGLQESAFKARKQQHGGPARGFWQFEEAGVRGVLTHQRSAKIAERCCTALSYTGIAPAVPGEMLIALQHNDVLAACFARLLLWTLLTPLPGVDDHELAWDQYFSAWRPGRPVPATWEGNYAAGWKTIGRV